MDFDYDNLIYYFLVIVLVIIFFSVLIGAFAYRVDEDFSEYYFEGEIEQSIELRENYCHNFVVENHNQRDEFYTYEINMEMQGTRYAIEGSDFVWTDKKSLGSGTFFLKEDKSQVVNFCYSIDKEFDFAKISVNFLGDDQSLFFTVVPK